MSSQGDDFEDNLDISDHAQGPQVGGNSDFFHGDEQHGAVAQNIVETMERIIDERLEKCQNHANVFSFRRKGNEKQFELNDKIKRRLSYSPTTPLICRRETLDAGIKKSNHRGVASAYVS